jgi:glutamine amidotransferase
MASRCAQAGDNGEPSKLNFLLTDGSVLLATRWRHSLCWSARKNSLLIASEAMDQERWYEVADETLLTVDSRLQMMMQPL